MKKHFLALLSLFLLAGVIYAPAVSAEFSDIDSSYEYRAAINTLTNLNIIDGYTDNTFKPLDSITRAEFTKMIVCTMGYDGTTMSGTGFTDIDGHWASNYISAAVSLNIISGFEDNTFRPDIPITYEQCLTMLDRALGYNDDAVRRGGYPTGYINTGVALGLTNKITGQAYEDPALRGVVAQVVYNSLRVPLATVPIGAATAMKEENEDYTFLNSYLRVNTMTGVLVGVSEYVTNECTTDLYPFQMDVLSHGKEYVLDFSLYTENVTDINKYLGHTITVYYSQPKSTNDYMLFAMDAESAMNTSIEIFYKDIYSYKGNSLRYYDSASGEQRSSKINPSTTTIRYNGKIVNEQDSIPLKDGSYVTLEEALSEWFNASSDNCIYGDITLTTSADGQVSLVQINDYKVIVPLRTPSSTDYRIMDKLVSGNSLTLDPGSIEYNYTITKNNLQIPITSLAVNDVVLYTESLDGQLYTLIATAKTVSGSISSMDSSATTVTIDGTKYDVGKYCADYIAANQSGQSLKVGASGTFYLDKYNTIVFATINEETAPPYAYIANAFIDEGTEECYVTVFESAKNTTSTKTYKLKSKVKFNGSNLNDEDVVARLAETARGNNADEDMAEDIYGRGEYPTLKPEEQRGVYSQVARVGFEGNIVSNIITLDNELEGSANENKQKIVRQRELGNYQYRSNAFSSEGSSNVISTNSSTVVLCIPKDRTDKTGYAQKTVSSAFTTGESYFVEAYDVNSSRIAGLLLVYSGENGALTGVTRNSNFAVVADIPASSVDSSTDSYSLTFPVYWGPESTSITSRKTWNTYYEDEFDDIEVGDVIQFSYNAEKQIRDRINNIRFRDVEKVLDGTSANGYKYDWTETVDPSTDPNHQSYKFDYRFKSKTSSGEYIDEMYSSSTLGSVPYARACMYNVMQVINDTNQIYVTKHGFDENGQLVKDDDYEVITVSPSTRFLKMNDDRESLSLYSGDSANTLKISDLLDVQYYGEECSKILVCSQQGEARLIIIYK